eukprot:979882-Pelagomonas_calceolata.AAC.1
MARLVEHLEVVYTVHCVVVVRLVAGYQAPCLAGVVLLFILHYVSYCGVPDVRGNYVVYLVSRARSDQDSIRAAG